MKICSYRELIANPKATVHQLFDFAGLDFAEQTKGLLRTSEATDKDPYSANKIIVKDDKWKTSLLQEIIDEIKSDPTYKTLRAIFNWQE
jgi:hypothetical protein